MANDKKTNAVYEPGELSRVREKLGKFDATEARRMAQILGGEVGTEKNIDQQAGKGGLKRKTVEMAVPGRQGRRSGRLVEVAGEDEDSAGNPLLALKSPDSDPADDPSILLRTSYRERVKMDRYAAQFEFEIKNSFQVFTSIFSFANEPSDFVNARFVSRRMNVYYNKIELLVTSTRNLFPRNNARRSERLKKSSPFVFSILDTLRHWNIERIGSDLARIQAHPRSVRVTEFADIVRSIYRPLFILEKLDIDIHIKGAYKLLYKLLLIENPMEPKEKHQDLIRTALVSFADIRREVHYGLYPLVMKFISDRWFPYEKLFVARHYRFMAFISTTESEQVQPLTLSPEQMEDGNLEALREDIKREEEAEANGEIAPEEEDPNDPKVIERKAHEAAAEAEQKAVEHSVGALNTLFPKAGWEKLAEFPDLFPYFSKPYGLRNGFELISPTDPVQQAAMLMHIMESICVGLHSVSFDLVTGPDGNPVHVGDAIGDIITNWQRYIDESFIKEYLPRLSEYCRMLEHSPDAKNSVFAKRTMNELRWTRRLYFLPYYKFVALGPPPFKNQETTAMYTQVRTLRKYLTMVAAGIEQGNRRGGAAAKAPCSGINNPWAQYHFEIPNPVSRRLDALLPPAKRNNAVLVFFALSTATVLDNLLNSESSWAYDNDNADILFRSVNGEGNTPVFGVEEKVDADQIFRNSLKQRQQKPH
ncbi:MAG: hypothetical protein LBH20_05675 [Treponema sp.]|jgi:hypothetical protein|nr:hypothetical protein [Treponema sp.]